MAATPTTHRRIGGFSRFSSSLLSAGSIFQMAPITSPDPNTISNSPRSITVSIENVLRSVLLKLLKSIGQRKWREIKDDISRQIDLLTELVKENQESICHDSIENIPADNNYQHQLCLSVILKQHNREFFQVFQKACHTQSSKILLAALDGIQKLLACGFFSSVTPMSHIQEIDLHSKTIGKDEFENKNLMPHLSDSIHLKRSHSSMDPKIETEDDNTIGDTSLLIDEAVKLVIEYADFPDDQVQLQVIRCLLTAVTAFQCNDLHGKSLTAAVRGVFKIYGSSKDVQNQRTAQAALTQIVNSVIRRIDQPTISCLDNIITTTTTTTTELTDTLLVSPVLSNCSDNVYFPNSNGILLPSLSITPLPDSTCPTTRQHSIEDSKFIDALHSEKVTNLNHNGIDEKSLEHGNTQHESESMYIIASSSSIQQNHLTSPISNSCHSSDVLCHLKDNQIVHETVTDKQLSQKQDIGSYSDDEILCIDALMVFQSLCKLSMQDIVSSPTDNSSFSDQSLTRLKRLSLELLLSMLQNSCNILKNNPKFINCIRSFLCISLIKNCVSHVPKIFSLSLGIFLILAVEFKDRLAAEIGVFVDQILLRILESGHCSFEHKHRVLQVLHRLFVDPRVALELYFNFDCDVDEKDVFARTVDCLAKLSQGGIILFERTSFIQPAQQAILQQMALETLVTLVIALLEWVKQCQEELDRGDNDLHDRNECPKKEMVDQMEFHSPTADHIGGNIHDDLKQLNPTSNSSASRYGQQNQHDMIHQQRQRKLQFHEGISKFNIKPKRGLEFLINNGYLNNTPASIAMFFLRSSGLDKKEIGNYLGENLPFNQQVLHELVDQLEFQNLEIDTALRKFLSTFRLPGEAQKIDRMMEKFAEKYVKDNPGKFATADCAYVLAFSLIMLHTDAHSKSIKIENKMSVDVFVRNNRGINDNQDLPVSYLEKLYFRVVSEEWVMEEDADKKAQPSLLESQQLFETLSSALGLSGSSTGRRKFELFLKESKRIVTKTTELIRQKEKDRTGDPSSINNGEVIVPRHYIIATIELVGQVRFLFQSICMPLVATFSVLLQSVHGHSLTAQVIEGFVSCIRLASRFELVSEIELFITSLAKFTGVTFSNNPAEILLTTQNICTLSKLLEVALTEGNSLGNGWQPVLECVSRLHRLELVHSRCSVESFLPSSYDSTYLHSDLKQHTNGVSVPVCKQFQESEQKNTSDDVSCNDGSLNHILLSNPIPFIHPQRPVVTRSSPTLSGSNEIHTVESAPTIEQLNADAVMEAIDTTIVELLFVRSTTLSPVAIVQFVNCLCDVSKAELASVSPRIFSLQKLVEVAAYNMNRIRLIWGKIWAVLREHFVEAALHSNIGVSLYAVDSLRQLAMKFLEKDELSNYSFQIEFLKPLQIVMSTIKTAEEVKQFIVDTIFNMIQARAGNIKSGWKSVFNILNSAASLQISPSQLHFENIAYNRCRQALNVVAFILQKHFWTAAFEHLGEVVRTLVTFASLKRDGIYSDSILMISIEALRYLEGIAVALAGEDYRIYLTQSYCNCEKVIIMENNLPIEKKNETDDQWTNDITKSFIKNGYVGISKGTSAEKYIRLLWKMKDSKSLKRDLSDSFTHQLMSEETIVSDSNDFKQDLQMQLSGCWFPIFTGLTQLATSPTAYPEIREASLDSLFRLLIDLGKQHMSQDMWQMTIRGVLFPLFDDLHLHLQEQELHHLQKQDLQDQLNNEISQDISLASSTTWAQTRCSAALNHLVELVYKQFDCVRTFLTEILALMVACIEGQPEPVARLGVDALKHLIERIGPLCTPMDWDRLITGLHTLFIQTAPIHLSIPFFDEDQTDTFISKNEDQLKHLDHESIDMSHAMTMIQTLPFQPSDIVRDCVVQLLLIDLIHTTIIPLVNDIPRNCIDRLLLTLKDTFYFARKFNRRVQWRFRLKSLGFMRDMRQLPGLLKQEREGLSTLLTLLFCILSNDTVIEKTDKSQELYSFKHDVKESLIKIPLNRPSFLVQLCEDITDQYMERHAVLAQDSTQIPLPPNHVHTTPQLIQIEAERELFGMTPIFLNIMIKGLTELPSSIFDSIANKLYKALVQLTLCSSRNLRLAIRDLLLLRFPPLLDHYVLCKDNHTE